MSETPVATAQPSSPLRLVTFIAGAWNMVSWASYLPSIGVSDATPSPWYVTLHLFMILLVQPLVTLPGLYLAYKNEKLKLAAILVGIPWAFFLTGVIAFGIGVAIYGF